MGNWNFNNTELAETFTDYVRQHVHYYNDILHKTLDIAEWFLPSNPADRLVLDFGCGSGELLELFNQRYTNVDLYGVDISPEMLEVATQKGFNVVDSVDLLSRYDFPVVVANLVLQFNTYQNRETALINLYNRTAIGGVIVVTEKVQSDFVQNSAIQRMILHQHKINSKVTHREVLEKDMQIAGVLKPLTVEGNINLISGAGFKDVELMFKFGEFCVFMGTKL